MASVSYYLRSKVLDKECTIWVRFRDKNIDLKVPVPFLSCKPKDWKDGKCKVASKKVSENDVDAINVRLSKLEADIVSKYKSDNPEVDIKEWLESVIEPQKMKVNEETKYSDEVLSFFDVYINLKKNENASLSTIKKANVVKNLLSRYIENKQAKKKTFANLKFKDLDNHFRTDFESYCKKEMYSISTTYRDLKFLKTICKVAESFDIDVHKHVIGWRFEVEKATKHIPKSIYLTFEELEKIENAKMPHDYLDNARDWLLIACYTAQRVSDYLRFTSQMIVEDTEGQKYIEFTQKKTNAKMKIPLLKKVLEILAKREGGFPRSISEVNLNLYIKQVCEIAKLNEMVYNGKTEVIKREGEKSITRKVFGEFPKHQLVTSHIGRKSFASNFYEKIPTAYLLNFTGHTTEKQLLAYINKTDVEKAKSTAKFFSNLGY
ncbi:phage integrase SAM-like domain-containing protein [Chryseobacterium carnipullorum]|uniref:phage integrase SAM-like domain-containing protein n=1 Tax=Chryseobacterium carnipullorum TaxID=1124835 RepID=UPI0023F39686|nr:phage integrase SAM-like domain-containing protein [Chryseobacterium carnipullorum]